MPATGTPGSLSQALVMLLDMTIRDTVVYGERVGDLVPGMFAIRDSMTVGPDGGYRCSVVLDPNVGSPLRRALMRAEAELLLEDADAVGMSHAEDRTPEQRAADALVRLT